MVAGLSGADNSAQVETLEGLLHRVGLARVLVGNDGYLPVAAECSGGIGIAYNCGTGVCGTAIDAHGKMSKIGGLDEWSDDMGGGVWLLQQIFKSVYDDVKLSLIESASADARARAEKIAENAGTAIGRVASAKMGVFQITGANSNEEFSAGGSFNTTSRQKKARITMKVEYRVK